MAFKVKQWLHWVHLLELDFLLLKKMGLGCLLLFLVLQLAVSRPQLRFYRDILCIACFITLHVIYEFYLNLYLWFLINKKLRRKTMIGQVWMKLNKSNYLLKVYPYNLKILHFIQFFCQLPFESMSSWFIWLLIVLFCLGGIEVLDLVLIVSGIIHHLITIVYLLEYAPTNASGILIMLHYGKLVWLF